MATEYLCSWQGWEEKNWQTRTGLDHTEEFKTYEQANLAKIQRERQEEKQQKAKAKQKVSAFWADHAQKADQAALALTRKRTRR